MDERVFGFVGLGTMGRPMASRLPRAGYRLAVFDVESKAAEGFARRDATVVGFTYEVADTAHVVVMAPPRPDVVRAVRGLHRTTRDHLGAGSDLTTAIRTAEKWVDVAVRGRAAEARPSDRPFRS